MWISHAELRPRVAELCRALAVKLRSVDFNSGNVPSMSTLIGCCQGFIAVDKERSTVRLTSLAIGPGLRLGRIGPGLEFWYLGRAGLPRSQAQVAQKTPENCPLYWCSHTISLISSAFKQKCCEPQDLHYLEASILLGNFEPLTFIYPFLPLSSFDSSKVPFGDVLLSDLRKAHIMTTSGHSVPSHDGY